MGREIKKKSKRLRYKKGIIKNTMNSMNVIYVLFAGLMVVGLLKYMNFGGERVVWKDSDEEDNGWGFYVDIEAE